MRRMLLTAALLAAALPAGAQQVYKWIDKDGTVHFTDSPPDESVNAERLVLRGATRSTLVEIQPRGMTRDEVDLLYTPEQRRAACEQARANRTTLRNMTTVMLDKDGDGVPEELTPEEKATELERAESQVQLLCRDEDGTG
ncbi:MAG: DUF4124 domain-containing protein [Pseudoxanthomonas sp.]|nr:DUF4124 domain-containing protein [Pseudoxanthomonas sp.]